MGRVLMGLGWVLGLGLGACDWEAFRCSSDEACVDGAVEGVCQPDGWCSFPDASCASSQRYAELSGDEVAGECVPVEGPDGSPGPDSGDEPDTGSGLDRGHGCWADDECDDGLFCNGAELCRPDDSRADEHGCVAGPGPCADDAECSEDSRQCVTSCAGATDADGDGHDSIECGGDDCDDSAAGIVGPGDWAHCSACNDSCGALQACEDGVCVPARRVFTSSTRHTGNLGGLEGAYAQCQTLADAAGLGGQFSPYITGSGGGLGHLEHPSVPFVRLDGVRIADDWDDLLDMSIDAPMNRDEWRLPVEGRAWTGFVEVFGSSTSNSCNDWTYEHIGCLEPGQPCGGGGQTGVTDSGWDGEFVYHCSNSLRIYCIEQDPSA